MTHPQTPIKNRILAFILSALIILSLFAVGQPTEKVAAAPAVTQVTNVSVPIYIGTGSVTADFLRIYVMRDPNTGSPVYCTRKGYSLPTSSFELLQDTINANPLLFYRLNYVYTTYSATSTTTLPYHTPNTHPLGQAPFDYSAIEDRFGFIANQIAVWMVLGEMGFTSGTLSGGTYNGYNLYDAYLNGSIDTYTQTEYNARVAQIDAIPFIPQTERDILYSQAVAKRNGSVILYAGYTRARAALSQTGSYTLGSVICNASLTNQSAWSYDSVNSVYRSTVTANVTNGGTWVLKDLDNCTASPSSGADGATINITATYAQMIAGASITIRPDPPAPSGTRVFSAFTSNGQSFVSTDYRPTEEGDPDSATWDPLAPPDIQLRKVDSETGVGVVGAHFRVWSDSSLTTVVFDGNSGTNGYFTIEDVADQTYWYREISPAPDYELDTTLRTFTVAGGVLVGGTTVIPNTKAPEIDLLKRDSETNNPVAGATIGVYSDAACTNLLGSGTTNGSGIFTTPQLSTGVYYWREIAVPANYHMNPNVFSFTVTAGVVTGTTTFYDTPYPDIPLQKVSADDPSLGIPGAEFAIYTDAGLTTEYDRGTTDANGEFILYDVPDGQYYFVETIAPAGYLLDTTVYSFSVVDGHVSGTTTMADDAIPDIVITKTGSDTMSGVAGSTITVYSDAALTTVFFEGVTDANGQITLSNVADGQIWYQETATVPEYNICPDVFSFTVINGTLSGTTSFVNMRKTDVTLTKTDEASVPISGTEFAIYTDAECINEYARGTTNASGEFTAFNVADGNYYWREEQESPGFLPDTTIHEINIVDGIITGPLSMTNIETRVILWKQDEATSVLLDGAHFVISDSDGTQVAEGTTQSDGSATFTRLPVGTYTFIETAAPAGFLLSTQTYTFTINADGSITGETNVANVRQEIELIIHKEKESGVWNTETSQYDIAIFPAEGIIFSIYAGSQITDPGGNIIYEIDDLVETIQTGANGTARTTTDLYYGSYYAIETSCTTDVVIDNTRYDLTVTQQDQTTLIAEFEFNDGIPITNDMIQAYMQIYKIAGDTTLPLVGVTFEIYDEPGNLVDVLATDESGHATTRLLPYGNYTLIETETVTGYALLDQQDFSIYLAPSAGTPATQEMDLINQRSAQIEVYKVSDEWQVPLAGVTFGVYTLEGDLVSTIVTDAEGVATCTVPQGEYYLQEIEALPGYQLDLNKYDVSAEWAGVYRHNNANQLTQLRVTKTSTDGTQLAGMGFTITNAEGALVPLEWNESISAYTVVNVLAAVEGEEIEEVNTIARTGVAGTATILGLLPGDYTITEVEAPDGYLRDSEPVTVSVLGVSDQTASATFVNAPERDTSISRTGETGSSEILPALVILSLGMCLSILYVYMIQHQKSNTKPCLKEKESDNAQRND